jgi:hypothetical protein
MPTTTNFGWTTPADTDLVKDGAAAIRTLAGNIDTSLVDLKGGTSGQVLSKNSNTDLDFTWVAQDDSNAIQNTIIDAKGDLISATAADTPARLASSAVNGEVLTVDTSTSTGLKWAAPATGGMTLLSTTSITGASTTVTGISTAYTDLYILIYDLSGAGQTTPVIETNATAGLADYVNIISNNLAGTVVQQNFGTDIKLSGAQNYTDNNEYNAAAIYIYNYANGNVNIKPFDFRVRSVRASGQKNTLFGGGTLDVLADITSIKVSTALNTFSTGTMLIYGVK